LQNNAIQMQFTNFSLFPLFDIGVGIGCPRFTLKTKMVGVVNCGSWLILIVQSRGIMYCIEFGSCLTADTLPLLTTYHSACL